MAKRTKQHGKWVWLKLNVDLPIEIRSAMSRLLRRLQKERFLYTNRDLVAVSLYRLLDDEGLLPPGFRVNPRLRRVIKFPERETTHGEEQKDD